MSVDFTNISDDTGGRANGCHFLGHISPTFAQLKAAFGEPWRFTSRGAEYDEKVRVEWVLEWEDGSISTIYDWKDPYTPIHRVTDWHVGGKDSKVLDYVSRQLAVALERMQP